MSKSGKKYEGAAGNMPISGDEARALRHLLTRIHVSAEFLTTAPTNFLEAHRSLAKKVEDICEREKL